MADPGDDERLLLLLLLFIHTTKKTSATEPRKENVVGTRSIFKTEKSGRIWKPCERALLLSLKSLQDLS